LYKKNHTIDASTFNQSKYNQFTHSLKGNNRLINSSNERMIENNITKNHFEKHRQLIESSKPIINYTSISKFASKLKELNDEQLRSASNLTIDDVLNIIELPPSLPSKLELWKNKQSTYTASFNRKSLGLCGKSFSICENSNACSFDEKISTKNSSNCYFSTNNLFSLPENEHKLKVLESNFNQIAMSHYLDEQLVQTCIEMYKEKYNKLDNHINLLFEEINGSLNKLVSQINTNNHNLVKNNDDFHGENNKNGSYGSSSKSSSLDSSYNLNDSNLVLYNSNNNDSINSLNSTNSRFLQENLNCLKRDLTNLRKAVIDMITTSSTISGLKQVFLFIYTDHVRKSFILYNLIII
jgi:hypothetical protein